MGCLTIKEQSSVETPSTGYSRMYPKTDGRWYSKDDAGNEHVVSQNRRNIWIPAGAMTPSSTNGAESGTNEYPTNDINIDYFAFDPDTDEFVEFDLVMPEDWDRGTIKVKFYWAPASGGASSGDVVWSIQAGAISNDDPIDAALGTAQSITDTVIANGDLHISGATPAITVGGSPVLGDMIHFKISRDANNASDTMTGDAWLFGVFLQIGVSEVIEAW